MFSVGYNYSSLISQLSLSNIYMVEYICMCIFIYVYIRACVYIYVYIATHIKCKFYIYLVIQ